MLKKIEIEHDSSVKKPQKLFFVLFGFLFLISPFYYQPNFGGGSLRIPHNNTLWIAACLLIIAAVFILNRRKELILPRFWLGLAILPIGTLLSGFIADNVNPTQWMIRTGSIIGGYVFFLSLYQFQLKQRHIDRGLYLILTMGMIAATFGTVQTFPHNHLAWLTPISQDFKPIGIFQQVNIQATMMTTVILLAFYLISRPPFRTIKGIVKFALFLTIFLAAYNLASSGSRIATLSFVISFPIILLCRYRYYLKHKNLLLIGLACLILGGLSGQKGVSKTVQKFEKAVVKTEQTARWQMNQISWQLFLEKPIFGHGVGSFEKVFQDKRAELQKNNEMSLGKLARVTHPHNEFLFWMVEAGLISIIGILVAAFYTFKQLIAAGWYRGGAYAALLVPLTLHTQVEFPFYISNTAWILLLFLLFITHFHGTKKISLNKLSVAANTTIPVAAALLVITVSTSLIHTLYSTAGTVHFFKSGQREIRYLDAGRSNFFYSYEAMYLSLRALMMQGVAEKDKAPIERFVSWVEPHQQQRNYINLYVELAIAHNALGNIAKRDILIQQGLDMYEGNRHLINLRTRYESIASSNASTASQAQPQASHTQ